MIMAQRNPEESLKVQQVLKLVGELTPEERDEVLYQLKLEDLRREIQKGIDSADRGELYSEEEVMAYLDEHHKQRLEKQTK
jgi:predicted transcriptional regulator